MKIFKLTSPSFKGAVIFKYNNLNLLILADYSEAELTPAQLSFMLKNQPNQPDFNAIKGNTGIIEEVSEKVTFEMFWIRYDDRLNSSKKKTQQKWNKMSERDQSEAYNYINTYFLNLPYGTRKKYAETYLNSEIWNN